MAQTKAQLLNPLNGSINVSGIVTSGGFKVGTGISIVGSGVAATAFYGDGSNLTNVVNSVIAGDNISVSGSTGNVTITGLANTSNVIADTVSTGTLNVTGISTFTGNVSVGGTLTYEDVTNVDSIGIITARSGVRITTGGLVVTAGVSTLTTLIPDETRFVTVAEKLTRIDGNTVNLTYSSSGSNIGLATNPSGDITLNVTGIPTSSDFDNHVLTFSVFVTNTGTARSCTAVNLNGVSKTINWAGGSLGDATSGVTTSTGIDIYSFTGINTVGSASTTANYRVLGVVNGGYR